jgi:hypothetical protein
VRALRTPQDRHGGDGDERDGEAVVTRAGKGPLLSWYGDRGGQFSEREPADAKERNAWQRAVIGVAVISRTGRCSAPAGC